VKNDSYSEEFQGENHESKTNFEMDKEEICSGLDKSESIHVVRLKSIKEKLNSLNDYSEEDLQRDINNISISLWGNINNIEEDNLEEICNVHEFLLCEILKIHRSEECDFNNELMKNNISIKKISGKLNDGRSASRIYFLNDGAYNYYFVGDIHSDDFIIDMILNKVDFYKRITEGEKIRIVFLGDYVDRGKEHLKTLEKIMILKFIFPGNIYLLRGNHDGGEVDEDVVKLCVRKPEEDKEEDYFLLYLNDLDHKNRSFPRKIIGEYLKFFNSMGIMAFVNFEGAMISAVHGGIPRPLRENENVYDYISCLRDLTDDSKINSRGETMINNILWSDPLIHDIDKYENTRRFGFREEEFNIFSETIGIDILIRGHEAHEDGWKSYFNDRVYCIFASGTIFAEEKNINHSTAYEWVNPVILKLGRDKLINIMDLNSK